LERVRLARMRPGGPLSLRAKTPVYARPAHAVSCRQALKTRSI